MPKDFLFQSPYECKDSEGLWCILVVTHANFALWFAMLGALKHYKTTPFLWIGACRHVQFPGEGLR